MNIKKNYESYWLSKTDYEFMDYERNSILTRFFDKKEVILDLGCGDGSVAEYLHKKLGMDVVGCDISRNAIQKASQRGINAVWANIENKLPFEKDTFDTVFWGDNIEHLFNPQNTLKEIQQVLKPEGRLILSCPNMGYWRYRFYYLFNGSLPDTEWTGKKPWNWDHIRFFNKKILTKLLESQGFKITKILGVNRRFPERYVLYMLPSVCAMIFVVEAKVVA